jgi:hypothetical protein
MIRIATLFSLTVIWIGLSQANAQTLSLTAPSTKICQLTGDVDWTTNQPTNAQTYTRDGLDAVDLGFPVDAYPGPLYFLFGDAWPTKHPPGSIPSVPPDDAVGWTMRTTPPDAATCMDMKIIASDRGTFAHPTVVPAIKQGSFNVPSGGVFVDKSLFAFFWTDHCAKPGVLTPDPGAPISIPPMTSTCLEGPQLNSVGQSVIARAKLNDPVLFDQTAAPPPSFVALPNHSMPSGFVYVSAARAQPGLIPGDVQSKFTEAAIPVFGVPRYRASVPYLAMAPLTSFGNPQTWSFYAGMNGGQPVWISRQQWEAGHNASGQWTPPPGAQIYYPAFAGEQCVGEHSITWNEPLHAWLMLYNCGLTSIQARTAPAPWGPWSVPTVLLSAQQDPGVYCTLIMDTAGCTSFTRRQYWQAGMPGFFYAPYVLNRFTQNTSAGNNRSATIYWTLSTWNPYQVIIMKSGLAMLP